jgi:hypothetical protein
MPEPAELERECAVFCRYLCGEPASSYVLEKYRAAHTCGAIDPPGGATSFDRALVALARQAWLTRAIDGYARVFAKGGLLRRKLVALLAILEVKAPFDDALDTPTSASTFAFFARLAWLGAVFALTLLVTSIVLLPVRAACALRA